MRRLVAGVGLGCVAIACDGCSRSPTSPTAPPSAAAQLSGLRISGNTSLTALGETSQLTVMALFSDGSEKDVSVESVWTSSDPTVVTVSPSGVITVLRFGATQIAARYENQSANVSVRPSPPGTFVITGWVREPGQGGVADVTVTDVGSLRSTRTGSGGTYTLVALPAPEARLRFDRSGYEPAELDATQTSGTASLQRIIRVYPGETVHPPQFAPNDFTYVVGGDRCFPCRLVRLVTAAAGTLQLRVTWNEPRVTLSLWANGSVSTGSNSELVADVPVPGGETIVFLGMKETSITSHVPFTIEAAVKAPPVADEP